MSASLALTCVTTWPTCSDDVSRITAVSLSVDDGWVNTGRLSLTSMTEICTVLTSYSVGTPASATSQSLDVLRWVSHISHPVLHQTACYGDRLVIDHPVCQLTLHDVCANLLTGCDPIDFSWMLIKLRWCGAHQLVGSPNVQTQTEEICSLQTRRSCFIQPQDFTRWKRRP